MLFCEKRWHSLIDTGEANTDKLWNVCLIANNSPDVINPEPADFVCCESRCKWLSHVCKLCVGYIFLKLNPKKDRLTSFRNHQLVEGCFCCSVVVQFKGLCFCTYHHWETYSVSGVVVLCWTWTILPLFSRLKHSICVSLLLCEVTKWTIIVISQWNLLIFKSEL